LLVRSGGNALLVGAVGGLIGAVLGVSATWLVASSASVDTRSVVLAAMVPAFLGGFIASWADVSALAWSRAAMATLKGAVVGATAGLIGFGIADAVFGALKGTNDDLGLLLGWGIVGALIGLGLGLYRSMEKALPGFVGGLLGGVAGGILMQVMGVSQSASFGPMLAAVCCASIIVGLSIGGAERITRSVWIDVLDGPLAGREFSIDKPQSVIGSAAGCDIHLALDDAVAARHAVLRVDETTATIEPGNGQVLIDGSPIAGVTSLTGQRVTIGACHFVLSRKQ